MYNQNINQLLVQKRISERYFNRIRIIRWYLSTRKQACRLMDLLTDNLLWVDWRRRLNYRALWYCWNSCTWIWILQHSLRFTSIGRKQFGQFLFQLLILRNNGGKLLVHILLRRHVTGLLRQLIGCIYPRRCHNFLSLLNQYLILLLKCLYFQCQHIFLFLMHTIGMINSTLEILNFLSLAFHLLIFLNQLLFKLQD